MNDNPFEFGIMQRVRRWFAGDPNGAALDAEFARRILPPVKTETPMPECKAPAFRNGLTRIGTKVPPPPPEYRPKPAMPPPKPDYGSAYVALIRHGTELHELLSSLRVSRAALIAVIEQWGPITFASETIEANKKKKISIVHQDGFVKFRIEGQPQEWPDESRIDIIGSNGNDGDHYAQG